MKRTLITLVLGAVMAVSGAAGAKKKSNPSNGGLPPGQAKKHRPAETVRVVEVQAPQRQVVVVPAPQPRIVVTPPRIIVTH
jgi:hypothetical protein